MDYTKGYTVAFYATFVDPVTWLETEHIRVLSGSVNRSRDSLRQNAELTVTNYDQPVDRWIRIYMECTQGQDMTRTALFTGLGTNPSSEYKDGRTEQRLQLYSVLKAAEDILLPRGYFAAEGMNGAEQIQALLSVGPAPVTIGRSSPKLKTNIVAEGNENNLTMALKILDAINWRLQITGDGEIRVTPKPEQPVAVMSEEINNVVETAFTRTHDWFSCPNVFRATSGDATCTVKDTSRTSGFSTISRGREVWSAEDSVTLTSADTIQSYAARRLQELQLRTEQVQYSRRYMPEINVDDMIRLNYDELQGVYTVVSQQIGLGFNAQTTEVVERTI